MRRWEIRLANQPPIRVDVDDARNLSQEYQAFRDHALSRGWRFWRPQPNPYWQISEEVALHHEIVAGIRPKEMAAPYRPVGFYVEQAPVT